jgi:hypothetical protein
LVAGGVLVAGGSVDGEELPFVDGLLFCVAPCALQLAAVDGDEAAAPVQFAFVVSEP